MTRFVFSTAENLLAESEIVQAHAAVTGHAEQSNHFDISNTTQSDATLNPALLRVEQIEKRIGSRTIVNQVSLELRSGEVVGLLGPNGAGKTTLFYGILGLIPIDRGNVWLNTTNITNLPIYRRARLGISYLPQEPSIFRGLSVMDNILAVLQIKWHNGKERNQMAEQILHDFGLSHVKNSEAQALSGGERRRLEIARAICAGPEFLLLDEPFAGVDPLAIRDIRELIKILSSNGIGVLITDHNVRETLRIVDRAYIIYNGQVIASGLPHEIIQNEAAQKLYLGDEITSDFINQQHKKN